MEWSVLAQGAMTFAELAQLAAQIGIPCALTLYFVFDSREREKRRDAQEIANRQEIDEREKRREAEAQEREKRMAARIDQLEDFQRNQLLEINNKTTAALIEDAAASRA